MEGPLTRGMLPLPLPSGLTVRQTKTEDGFRDDPVAVRQLEIIGRLLREADGAVTATDTSREGQLVARNLYGYLGFKGKTERLWLSSLTDDAIREAFLDLRPDSLYEGLYLAGRARREADRIIGYNASLALGMAAGKKNHSLGRVQTPVLALISRRYLESRDFTAVPYYRLELSVLKEGKELVFTCPEKYTRREDAAATRNRIAASRVATVIQVERKGTVEESPLLHDLASLQKEANLRTGLTAGQTASILQRLYEGGYISYPRTSCRHIREDMLEKMPALLSLLKDNPRLARHAETLEGKALSTHAADDGKVSGHHAIIITESVPGKLPLDEQIIYWMIAGRMLEAFSDDCTGEDIDVRLECGGIRFEAGYRRRVHAGWEGVYSGTGKEEDIVLPSWDPGEALPVTGISVRSVETSPEPFFTEASLLSEMERCGLGTPSTRAGVIELLIARRYVERQGCYLLPTPKGLEVYEAVRDKLIAAPEMTARWEKDLLEIERGGLDADVFIQKVEEYARQIVEELSKVRFEHPEPPRYRCPKCGMETLTLHRKVARCSDPDCAFLLFRTFNARELTDKETLCLLEGRGTDFLSFVSRKGRPYEASLKMDENYRIEMTFRDTPVERQPLSARNPSVMQAADTPVEAPCPGQFP
ncbi:type IA DNA topoisomerase [Phocaeicola dorei]|uniref:type IA DNA topoisomerase n=1 Tax=Phocaeicola dorei TaxID=357276 RepID=UPI0018751DEC|nr:type IA DNA topoisomerase [Phocaeicola dorei]MBE5080212.1 DNA topoisomerase III [Phocaeicola dorei]